MGDSLISGQASQGEEQQTQQQGQEQSTSQQEASSRPEWLPEKFFVEGKPAYELLAKSYGELETKFRSKEDELKARLVEELANEAVANRPEAADKYELPEIEGADLSQMANHPLVKWWADFSFENGFDQNTFKTGIETYIQSQSFGMPNPEEEIKALGDNAKARTEAVGLWVGKNFAADEIGQIERLCTTAAGVKVMERIMGMMRGEGGQVVDDRSPVDDEADVMKLMNDRRYWSPSERDPALVKRVEAFFQKKFK